MAERSSAISRVSGESKGSIFTFFFNRFGDNVDEALLEFDFKLTEEEDRFSFLGCGSWGDVMVIFSNILLSTAGNGGGETIRGLLRDNEPPPMSS